MGANKRQGQNGGNVGKQGQMKRKLMWRLMMVKEKREDGEQDHVGSLEER